MAPRRYSSGSLSVRVSDSWTPEQRQAAIAAALSPRPPPAVPAAAAVCVAPPLAPLGKAVAASRCLVVPPSPASSSAAVAASTTSTRRSDAPVIKRTRRGNASAALADLDALGVDHLVQELHDDRVAKSSKGDKETHLSTWTKFHRAAFGSVAPIFPITVYTLIVVSSLLKKGKYRSFENYLSTIRGLHIEQHHLWTQEIEHTSKWCKRSVLRGIGPARQSCPLLLVPLLVLNALMEPWFVGGPLFPLRACFVAKYFWHAKSSFLMRAAGASSAMTQRWRSPGTCPRPRPTRRHAASTARSGVFVESRVSRAHIIRHGHT